MTAQQECNVEVTLVAIDVAKTWNAVLVEKRDGTHRVFEWRTLAPIMIA